MNTEQVALLVALLALLVAVPAALAVLVLAMSVRSYERLYRLVQALLVGLISEVSPQEAGEMLVREAADVVVVKPRRPGRRPAGGSTEDIAAKR